MKNEILSLKEQAKNGMRNPLEIYQIFDELSKIIDSAKSEILPDAISEFEKYGEKQVSLNGYLVSKTGSARYDYKHISAWNKQKEKITKIEELAKAAEKAGDAIILETGEIIEPAIKSFSSSSLSFKAKKTIDKDLL